MHLAHSGALAGHLRLAAACGLVKLAAFREHDGRISGKCFEEIAYHFQVRHLPQRLSSFINAHHAELQDTFYEIRHTLLVKLRKYLPFRQHSARWYMLPFLVAADPETENKDTVRLHVGCLHRIY